MTDKIIIVGDTDEDFTSASADELEDELHEGVIEEFDKRFQNELQSS